MSTKSLSAVSSPKVVSTSAASDESDAPKKAIVKKGNKKSARNFRSNVHHMNSDINVYKAQEADEEARIAAENGTAVDDEEDADGKRKKKKGKKGVTKHGMDRQVPVLIDSIGRYIVKNLFAKHAIDLTTRRGINTISQNDATTAVHAFVDHATNSCTIPITKSQIKESAQEFKTQYHAMLEVVEARVKAYRDAKKAKETPKTPKPKKPSTKKTAGVSKDTTTATEKQVSKDDNSD